jgi:hypothetical protein
LQLFACHFNAEQSEAKESPHLFSFQQTAFSDPRENSKSCMLTADR